MSFSQSAIAVLALAFGLSQAEAKPVVYVPVLPYQYLFEQIGGDMIEVHSIVGEGDDCHDYSPTPRQLSKIAKANLLYSAELGFEANFFIKVGDGVNAPKAIDLLEGLTLLEGSCAACEAARKGNADAADLKHDHDDLKDPHVWLSPKMLRQQADKVATTLKPFLPADQHDAIDTNLKAFVAELDKLDNELRSALTPLKGQKFYVYHGAFAYFALDYGLEQIAIEIGNRRPTPKQLSGIAKQAEEDGVKVIFVQPQFDQSSAKSLAKTIGGKVTTLDPLEKDVVSNLRKIAEAMGKIH